MICFIKSCDDAFHIRCYDIVLFFRFIYIWVCGLQKIAQVACGWRHTLALTENKNVFSWGRGASGQLGHGEIIDR
uniref:Uncharacterized protein n=1 Tax=Aegilops tauschii subsp. strangulata TaxID=200361 RepID=A0A453NIV4_AEGTS